MDDRDATRLDNPSSGTPVVAVKAVACSFLDEGDASRPVGQILATHPHRTVATPVDTDRFAACAILKGPDGSNAGGPSRTPSGTPSPFADVLMGRPSVETP